MTPPTFASFDFGFANDVIDDYAAAPMGVWKVGTLPRRITVMFPGVDGAWIQNLGAGPDQYSMALTVFFKTEADEAAYMAALEALQKTDLAYTLTFYGRTFARAQLIDVRGVDRTLPQLAYWSHGRHLLLLFEVLE